MATRGGPGGPLREGGRDPDPEGRMMAQRTETEGKRPGTPLPDLEGAWTPRALAAQLLVHPATVRRWILRGQLRALRIGGRYRVPLEELPRAQQLLTEGGKRAARAFRGDRAKSGNR